MRRWLALWAGLGLGVNALSILLDWMAVQPRGSEAALSLGVVLALPVAAAFLAVPIGLVSLAFPAYRPKAVRILAAALIWIAAFYVCVRAGDRIRMAAMRELAVRSRPLVRAIHEFEKERGAPPQALTELVPRYLAAVPGTGLAAYPDFELLSGEKAAGHEGNPWVLSVRTPSGGINFDGLYYYPKQNYPERKGGDWWERVEEWAYLHE